MGGGAEAGFKALLIRTNPSEPPMYMLPSLATNAGLAKKSLGNITVTKITIILNCLLLNYFIYICMLCLYNILR